MHRGKTILNGLLQALAALLYCGLIALFMNWLKDFHGNVSPIIGFGGMLFLLSASVAVMGSIVFGRAVVWFLSSHKKEAIQLIIWTIGFMLLFFVFFLGIVATRGT